MSESIFQNSGCVNTINGSLIHLSSFLPVICPIDHRTTLNTKYDVQKNINPTSVPKLQYFGIGTNGFYCTGTNDAVGHIKYNPDCRNMDLYNPIPIRVVPFGQDLSWEERKQYRMRAIKTFNNTKYICYYLKKIVWDPGEIEIKQIMNNTEQDYVMSQSYLNPTPSETARTGEGVVTSSPRIVVRALGRCEVSMQELKNTQALFGIDAVTISEFGFYTGCESYIDDNNRPIITDIPEDDSLIDGATSIEAIYVQLAKHKTQLPVSLENEQSVLETTVSFESASTISI